MTLSSVGRGFLEQGIEKDLRLRLLHSSNNVCHWCEMLSISDIYHGCEAKELKYDIRYLLSGLGMLFLSV